MAAKINNNAVRTLSAKSFYTLLKDGLEDDALYTGVSYIPDSDWIAYSGSSDSDGSGNIIVDSDSIFLGGTRATEFDEDDKTFYNQTMYSMHKVYKGGVSRVIPRVDWTYGNTYNSFGNPNSYVLVKEYVSGFANLNVYQCLFSPRKPSLFAPSGTSQLHFAPGDGYVWKYMYSIENSAAIRFLNESWMPVVEKIKAENFSSITSSSPNYDQYIAQINAESGAVFGVEIDSDVFKANLDSEGGDSDLRVAFNYNSVQLVGRDVITNSPTKTMKVNVIWNATNNAFELDLIDEGKGYVGPITFGLDSDSTTISGLVGIIAPNAGHSSDVPRELNAGNIMISVRNISDDTSKAAFQNCPYNLVTLQLNPVDTVTGRAAANEFYTTSPYFETTTPNTYAIGDIIKPQFDDRGRRGEVISILDGKVYYIPTSPGRSTDTFNAGETIERIDGVKVFTVSQSYNRGIKLNSGDILIADKKESTVYREEGQNELFNFVLTF